jgi:hypothetical protein
MAKPHYGGNLYKDNNMAERSITEMLSPTTADPDATLVDVFGLKSKPADDYFEQLSNLVGSIRQAPKPALSEQELMDIAIGSAFPGAGVGASIRGGRQAGGGFRVLSKFWDEFAKKYKGDITNLEAYGLSSKLMGKKNLGILRKKEFEGVSLEAWKKFHAKAPKSALKKAPKSGWKKLWEEMIGKAKIDKSAKLAPRESEALEAIQKKNKEAVEALKLEKAREKVKAIQDKYGIADPDRQEFVDTITDLLTRSKN